MLVTPMTYMRPGTPMKPPTAMVAASMPVAMATGMRNHTEMRTLARLKVIIGHSSMDWRRLHRLLGLPSPSPDLARRRASRMTKLPTVSSTATKATLT